MTSSRRFALKKIAVSAFLASAGGLLAACQPDKPQFKAIDITGADYAQGFQLTDFNGRPRSLADYKGKVVVVFFGFTQCPDVCPTTMNEMAQVKKLLGTDGDKLQVVFISIDPERDTPQLLKDYLSSDGFPTGVIGLTGTPEQTAQVAKAYRAFYQKVGEGEGYTMNHSLTVYLMGPDGKFRSAVAHDLGPDKTAKLIERAMERG